MNNMNKDFSGFTAGTLVHTETGLVPIEQLKIGDNVLSKAANGLGELVYKPVKNFLVNDRSVVSLLELAIWIDDNLTMKEQIKLQKIVDKEEPIRLLVTQNHPFWTKNNHWSPIKHKTSQDHFINKDGIVYVANSGNNPYSESILSNIYCSNETKQGFVPYGEYDAPIARGSLIDLTTTKEIKTGVNYKPVLDKLYQHDSVWKQNLLDQTPAEHREHAEFFGFRQGEWKDPDAIDWAEGEGPLTMTVYNIEVGDTHTYFVGEAGIWVHE